MRRFAVSPCTVTRGETIRPAVTQGELKAEKRLHCVRSDRKSSTKALQNDLRWTTGVHLPDQTVRERLLLNQFSTFCICVCIQRMGEYLHQPCSHMLGGNQDGLGKGWGAGGAITSHFHRHLFIWPCKTESPTLLWICWPATPEALQLPVCIPLYIRNVTTSTLIVFHFQTHILLCHCSHSNTVLTLKKRVFWIHCPALKLLSYDPSVMQG